MPFLLFCFGFCCFYEADWDGESQSQFKRRAEMTFVDARCFAYMLSFPCSLNLCHLWFADVNYTGISTLST